MEGIGVMNSDEQFEAIVSEHYESLYRFAFSLTRQEFDARDLTQQTFYVWARKGHQLRDVTKVKTWLYTTLHRTFLMARRKQSRFTHHELETVLEQLPSILQERASESDCAQVLRALGNLDEVNRGAIALFYLEDWSYQDIAAILDVPLGTVKSRIARGVRQLRKILLSNENVSERDYRERDLSPAFVQEPVGHL